MMAGQAGGACLPKDSLAFARFAEQNNSKLNVLKTAISVNNSIRQQYNNDQRESDQNINFLKKIINARVVELVDTRDLKSLDSNIVPVQVRPRVPFII